MWKEILGGFLEWVKANEKVRMRGLDIQKEGLDLQARQVKIHEENGALDRQEKMLRITIAKSDLAARGVPMPPLKPFVVPDQPERQEEPCSCDETEDAPVVERTELEALKAEATELNIAFRSNVTEATLKKKIATFKKNSAETETSSEGEEVPPPVDDAPANPDKDYSGEEVRHYCRAHMATQKSVKIDGKEDGGRSATKAFLKKLTNGFETPSEMEKQDNGQELFNRVAAACIELGLTLPDEEGEEV